MKRIVIAISLILGLVAAVLIALPLFVSSESVRGRILAQMQDLTGRAVSFRGNPSVSFYPFMGIEISDLRISDPTADPGDPPLLAVEKLHGKLDLLPALFGRADIGQYQMLRPRLHLKVSSDGKANWHFEKGQLRGVFNQKSAEEQSELSSPIQLGDFNIIDGAIEYENHITGQTEQLTNLNGSLNWADTNAPLSSKGSAVWRGETISHNIYIEQPFELAAGSNSALSVEVVSTPLEFNFVGEANMFADLYMTGTVTAKSPSTARLFEVLQLEAGHLRFLGDIQAKGTISATASSIKLTDAKIRLSGNEATGVVQIVHNEFAVPKLDGTLAFGDVDISPFFFPENTNLELGDPNALGNLEVDLRLSANSMKLKSIMLNNLAAAISMQEHEWAFDIGDSSTFEGSVIARLGKQKEEDSASLDISARGINSSKITALLPKNLLGLTGLANIDARIHFQDLSSRSFLREANGEVKVNVTNGSVDGIDVNRLFERNEEQGGILQPLDGSGKTAFEQFRAELFIVRGIAAISDGMIRTGASEIRISGRADLYEGGLALRAQRYEQDTPSGGRLFIGGSITAPLVTLEPISTN